MKNRNGSDNTPDQRSAETVSPLSLDYPLHLLERALGSGDWKGSELLARIIRVHEAACQALEGQPIARHGFVHSGLSLFLESEVLEDGQMKAGVAIQALKTLADSSAKLEKGVLYDIQFLRGERGPDSLRRSMREHRRADMLDRIARELPVDMANAYVVTELRAGVYAAFDEDAAMRRVLREYAAFYQTAVERDGSWLENLSRIESPACEKAQRSLRRLRLDV